MPLPAARLSPQRNAGARDALSFATEAKGDADVLKFIGIVILIVVLAIIGFFSLIF